MDHSLRFSGGYGSTIPWFGRSGYGHRELVTSTAARKVGTVARRARRNPALTWTARAGLVARGLFYLLLASLVIRLAVTATEDHQADPDGALALVAAQPLGLFALGAAAFGFTAFAVARLVAAVVAFTQADRDWWDGVRASAETLAYAAMGALTLSFVFGSRNEGSEQSHRTFTAKLLDAPGGRALIIAIGLAVVGIYAYQTWLAVSGDFESRLDEKNMPRLLRRLTRALGTGGIAARVLAFVPVGVFLLVAGAAHQPHKALGLDATLRDASHHWWGLAVLSVMSVGLIAFGLYSFIEAAYRKVGDA